MSPTEPASDVTLTRPAEGVILVTLDRPAQLNALTAQMFDDFERIASDLRGDDSARVVILTGAGRGFCSGYDL